LGDADGKAPQGIRIFGRRLAEDLRQTQHSHPTARILGKAQFWEASAEISSWTPGEGVRDRVLVSVFAAIDVPDEVAEAAISVRERIEAPIVVPKRMLHDIRRPPFPKVVDGKPLSAVVVVIFYAKTVSMLAGIECERLFFTDQNPDRHGQGDIRKAEFMASKCSNAQVDFLRMARADAARVLSENRHKVEFLARELLRQKTLDASEIASILETQAMPVEYARRRMWEKSAESAAMSKLKLVRRVF
jgi:hypothetical protein